MTTIAFTGDIAFSRYFEGAWQKEDLLDETIVNFLSSADYVVPNVEGPLTGGDIKSGRPLNHASHPDSVGWLNKIGSNIWNLANNHITDCGISGVEDTLRSAKQNGALTVGAGLDLQAAAKAVELEREGGIGLMSVVYDRDHVRATDTDPGCVLWSNTELIRSKIQQIKKKNRWCILIVHGGEEFSQLPLPYVREKHLAFLEMGADIIIGHHPHVTQNYERVGDKIIFYSLGNFIFDTDYQRRQKFTDRGVLVKLTIDGDKYAWEHIGIAIDRQTHTVHAAPAVDIFREVPAEQYERLSAANVVDYEVNGRAAAVFVRPEKAEYTFDQWYQAYTKSRTEAVARLYLIDAPEQLKNMVALPQDQPILAYLKASRADQ